MIIHRLACMLGLLLLATFFRTESLLSESYSPKNVLIYHSYPPGEWVHGINSSFKKTVGVAGIAVEIDSVVYHSEFWDEQQEERRSVEKQRLLKISKSKKYDAIVLCDDEVTDLLIDDLVKTQIPIFVTGINRRKEDIPWYPLVSEGKVSLVLEHYRIEESIDLLKRLKPSVSSISILTSKNKTSEIVASNISKRMNEPEFQKRYGVNLRSVNRLRYWKEWKQAVPEINSEDSAVWVLVPYDVKDSNSQDVSIDRIGRWLRQNLTIPTIGIIGIHTKIGLLAGITVRPQALGRQTAEQVIRHFNGTPLSTIGAEKAQYFSMEINSNEAARLDLEIPSDLLSISSVVSKEELPFGR